MLELTKIVLICSLVMAVILIANMLFGVCNYSCKAFQILVDLPAGFAMLNTMLEK